MSYLQSLKVKTALRKRGGRIYARRAPDQQRSSAVKRQLPPDLTVIFQA